MTQELSLEQVDNGATGQYNVYMDDKRIGAISYSWIQPDHMSVDYVMVDPMMRGKGIGNKVMVALAEEARKDGYKITPVCGFARIVFIRDQRLLDVLQRTTAPNN